MAKIVKRIKNVSQKLKTITNRTKKALAKSASSPVKKRLRKKGALTSLRRSVTVEEIKYFTHPLPERMGQAAAVGNVPASLAEGGSLPEKYDKDVIVLQVRDPWWLHVYWEVCERTYQRLKGELAKLFETARKILRVYDVSSVNFNGSNARRYFDIDLPGHANSWYIDTASPGRSWCVDLGLRLSDGRFVTIARSNIVTTPLDGPSQVTDEEWAVNEELFSRLYASAAGLSGSPVKLKKPWQELKLRGISSGAITSAAFSPAKKREEALRSFWLVVNTELIVYGATEPDAKVTVLGKEVALRPDGTFSLRFSLPDGRQVIPVEAVSCDGIDRRAITPVVEKKTR